MSKTFKILLFTLSIFFMSLSFIFIPLFVFAQEQSGGTGQVPARVEVKIENPFSLGNNLSDLITKVLEKVIMPIGGTIVVLMIIWSGFLFVKARGNDEKLKEARKSLTHAVIGAAILLGAVAIATAVENTINALK
ncbi:MAG TPA: hypothetical protein VJJ27_01235 [Candidatus Paceibacterota bacterium]